MNNIKTLSKIAGLVIITSSVVSCTRFAERTQAEGDFDYQDVQLIDKFDSGDFSRLENRSTYNINELTDQQEKLGFIGEQVDVRPPSQLMAVLDGVVLDADKTQTKILFNRFKQNENIQDKVWDVTLQYLASKNAKPETDQNNLMIDTGPVVSNRSYGSISTNSVRETGDYHLQLANDGRTVLMLIDAQSYQLVNDGEETKYNLMGRTKRNVEISFANDLLEFAYFKQQSDALEAANNKPLPIKLGFDDNHQTAWIVDAEFIEVWEKLPSLLNLMSFDLVEDDKNLGYFLVEFNPQDQEYWSDNNLNPINLESGEYFVQLGELTGGDTSIIWLDADKKALDDQQVTELYLSITDNIRSVILENDKQTKPL